MAVADHSGQVWFQGFNDVGNVIFGMPADQVVEIKVRSKLPDAA
jgi:replication factor A1